jgi:hypothetical protein
MSKRPFKVYDHVQDRDDRDSGASFTSSGMTRRIVAVRFTGDRDDLAVPAESLRRAPIAKGRRRPVS